MLYLCNLLQIMRNAAETLTPVTLELGGKDAFIICEDADVSHVSVPVAWCSILSFYDLLSENEMFLS